MSSLPPQTLLSKPYFVMELVRETRWSLHYEDPAMGLKLVQSKFADGSVDISLEELEREWPRWDASAKGDFCHAVNEARMEHLPDIYRYIMKAGDVDCWSAIAAWVVRKLPKQETVDWLINAVQNCPVGKGEKLYQALELTGSREALPTLRKCLERIWRDPRLLRATGYFDEPAHDAVCCIECMLRLGDYSDDLGAKYSVLANHSIEVNRQNAINRLSSFFEH